MQKPLLSQNGWPAAPDRNAIRVKNFIVPGTKRYFAVATEAAPLLIEFVRQFHLLIEPIDVGIWDDWGFHFAFIPGSESLSNHASGTAVDLDASKHNWGSVGTFPPAKVPVIHRLAKEFGLRWGGDYTGCKRDEMHFEINISRIQAAILIKSLKLPTPQEKK